MPIDPRTPVLVGAGQHTHRATGLDDALDPSALMEHAIRAAASDAGLSSVPQPDSMRVVGLLSHRYGDPAWVVADRMGLHPRETAVTPMGGNSPQSLVNSTSLQILAGELDLAILTGAEAWRTRMRYRKAGTQPDWPTAPEGQSPKVLGEDLTMSSDEERARGIVMPIQAYPMFETAIRAKAGRTPREHLDVISGLWSRFSEVASRNPYAWIQDAKTPAQIRDAGPGNRMVGLPYTKYMNSNNDVDQGAALILCSASKAEALGVARDRWVFPLSGADCHEHPFMSNRWSFAETPAVELGGRLALEMAGLGIDNIDIVDLYSCFPSAVQLGAQSLGLSLDRQLTRTGGLSFAGGPWNNYVMHSIATVARELREQAGSKGLVWANGGFTTKHAFGVYSTEPGDGFRHAYPQAEIDAMPQRTLADPGDAAGTATVEAYTVMHDRDGNPELGIAACLLADGRRAWGTSSEDGLAAAMCEGEWVGRSVTLDSEGTLHA